MNKADAAQTMLFNKEVELWKMVENVLDVSINISIQCTVIC